MTEESSTTSHLSVAMTTTEDNETPTVGEKSRATDHFYAVWAVMVIGVVGTAGNGLILYALVASKQHKKHILIVNQNALDLFSCCFLIVTFAVQLRDIQFVGASGYWLCITLISGIFVWWGIIGSVVNLAIITIHRYLKVVHHTWSKKRMRPWMMNTAVAFPWLVGIVSNTPFMLQTSGVIDGTCYTWILYKSNVDRIISLVTHLVAFYLIILVIFVYCYGRILVVVRGQARVMASHGAAGSSSSHTQSHHIQTNIIKTMIIISALYAVAWLPTNVYRVFLMINPNLTYSNDFWYAPTFAMFFYASTNPFIYATKFDPVRRILKDIIACKKTSVQPSDGT